MHRIWSRTVTRSRAGINWVGRLLLHHNYDLESFTGLEGPRTVRGELLISPNTF